MSFFEFNYKMVIAIRSDLKLPKAKIAIYASHAAVLAVEDAKKKNNDWLKKWLFEGQKKVVVQVSTEQELKNLYQKAINENLPNSFVCKYDQENKSEEIITAIAIGPSPNTKIDKFTANLKLL